MRGIPWPHNVPPEMLLVLVVAVMFALVVWGAMTLWDRWDDKKPKRRLPR